MLRDRMAQRNAAQGAQGGGFKFPRWGYVVIGVLAVIGLIIFFSVRGCGGEKVPETLATVTMTWPSDSTVNTGILESIKFKVSDPDKAKHLKVKVNSPAEEVKGSTESFGSEGEAVWTPKETITEPGFYAVSVSGKGVQDGAFYFSIPKKEEKINPPPPPPPAPQQGQKSERSKVLDDLEQKYPVQ
ncbi:MAG: hypothetical protein PHW01_02280 [Patescibacteria group bacterium]|nr:hypothetical protein [Patescibacteria group bacterium]